MTLALLMNMGFAASGVAAPVFNSAWAAVRANVTVGWTIEPK